MPSWIHDVYTSSESAITDKRCVIFPLHAFPSAGQVSDAGAFLHCLRPLAGTSWHTFTTSKKLNVFGYMLILGAAPASE